MLTHSLNLPIERDPDLSYEKIHHRTFKEISLFCNEKDYRIFVAEYANEVIAFGRCFHMETITPSKVIFPSPAGFFCMGTIVSPKFRRRGVANLLFQSRFDWLKSIGATEVYSAVSSDNPSSLKMHEKLGFNFIDKVPGVHIIKFDNGEGFLYKKELG